MVQNRRELVHNIVAGVLTTALVFSLSIFLYATFYHAYMPIEVIPVIELHPKSKHIITILMTTMTRCTRSR